jgi:preprotein translocase subunit SecF
MSTSKFKINFVGKFPVASVFSILMVLAALGLFFSKGVNYGVDFRGGAEIQVKFSESIDLNDLRSKVSEGGIKISSVQSIGDVANYEYLIKVPASEANINQVTDEIGKHLMQNFGDKGLEIRKTDIVGPKAGEQLKESGYYAMAYALIAILLYIGLRFDVKYAPGAIVALAHDVLIIIGLFILTDKEFSLQIVGALLAVIGYSVNDTVVVYDRVREYEDKGTLSSLKEIINVALNETLTRTILTSATTLFVSLTMFFGGGGIIHDFFFVISLGVIIEFNFFPIRWSEKVYAYSLAIFFSIFPKYCRR